MVHAIRKMSGGGQRRISIIGHSQEGWLPAGRFRFWPDTRRMVDDLIGLAPNNHGTIDADVVCVPGCSPAFWQQRSRAEFIKALNSTHETFPGSPTRSFTRVRTRSFFRT